MALRWFLVGTQYRSPINYTVSALHEASDRLYYICETLHSAATALHDTGAHRC
jgi:cysteinyl-tRNA synthetase